MPFFPYLGEALDFRTRLFDEGNEHSAINTASSALSTIVTFLCQTPFGKDTLVCRLLKGISQQRPTRPSRSGIQTCQILRRFI